MCADCDVVRDGEIYGNGHTRRITGMPATGDVATANNAHQLDIESVTLTEIRVQVDRSHCEYRLQKRAYKSRIEK